MQVSDLFLKGKQTQERHAAELQSVIYMQWQEIVVKWNSLNTYIKSRYLLLFPPLIITCIPMPDQLGHRPSHHKVEFFNLTIDILPLILLHIFFKGAS